MKARAKILSAFIFMACSSSAYAETSSEYAKLGRKIWAAFECAIAAEKMENREARARLFDVGYENGRRFLEALAEGKIDAKDVKLHVAVGVLWSLQGPNADFSLGRIWENAADEYYRKVQDECPECYRGDILMKIDAENRYREMNCDLLE